ncbi:hypothetical protein COO60DRAFT_1702828 [Scenedesmus sp. NREL 46B-D3]|nr:hypothetical protein COO60DRAFT_1702828 [Scenedesmus sp. NREL 46B-D3]
MGLVVIALDWPSPQWVEAHANAAKHHTAAPGRTIRPDAQYRWQLLRLAVKFHMAYRRALRSRWYELAKAVEAAAAEAARQAEVHAWKSQGAAVKVNLAGDVMDTASPMRIRNSPHKLPMQSTSMKRPSPMRTSGIGASSSSSSTYSPAALAAGTGAGATPIRSSAAAAAAAAAQHTPARQGAVGSTPDASAAGAARTPSSASKPKAPAPLQIYERDFDGCNDNASDIESPSRLDSPSKAAKSAAAAAAAPAAKKQGGASLSPTKAHSRSQSLSLRGQRSAAAGGGSSPRAADGLRAAGQGVFAPSFEQQGRSGSPGLAAEASWGAVSRSLTPVRQEQLLLGSRSSAGQQWSAGKAGVAGAGSPARRSAQGTPPAAASGSRLTDDYSGYHASGYGAGVAAAGGARSRGGAGGGGGGGGGGSPTRLGRAGKLSLRKPASHY